MAGGAGCRLALEGRAAVEQEEEEQQEEEEEEEQEQSVAPVTVPPLLLSVGAEGGAVEAGIWEGNSGWV